MPACRWTAGHISRQTKSPLCLPLSYLQSSFPPSLHNTALFMLSALQTGLFPSSRTVAVVSVAAASKGRRIFVLGHVQTPTEACPSNRVYFTCLRTSAIKCSCSQTSTEVRSTCPLLKEKQNRAAYLTNHSRTAGLKF